MSGGLLPLGFSQLQQSFLTTTLMSVVIPAYLKKGMPRVLTGLAALYLFYELFQAYKPTLGPALGSVLDIYNARIAYIQRVKECINGNEIEGCRNGVYCTRDDLTYQERGVWGWACTNIMDPKDPTLFEDSKEKMHNNLEQYLKHTRIPVVDEAYAFVFYNPMSLKKREDKPNFYHLNLKNTSFVLPEKDKTPSSSD